jgi:hypothetical protein
MTTYIGTHDLNTALDGFVDRYYGTYLDGGEDLSLVAQWPIDLNASFDEVNEILGGITHVKQLPFGTQAGGNYPYHVRMLQSNLMIWHRLRSKHFGEFTDSYPAWVNAFKNVADQIVGDIRGQNVVFQDDITTGESGIGVGTFNAKAGSANWFTNWETGIYTGYDFPRTYVIEIDGTTAGSNVGESTFRWSKDNGNTWEEEGRATDDNWVGIDSGLVFRWETVGTGVQLSYGDRFSVRCIPKNIPQKGGNIRYVTFKRG